MRGIQFGRRTGRALLGLVVLLLAAGCNAVRPAAVPAAPTPAPPAATRPAFAQGLPTLTPIPGLKATLTALPKQPPMPAEQARPYRELRAAVEKCNAYNPNRKLGILSQIDYVLQPATVPSDFVILYGNRWPGRMIYGAAYLSALEWKLAGRDPNSCLYPIGVSFNALLVALGEETFPEFR